MSATVKLRAGAFDASGQLTAGSMARAIADALEALVPLATAEDPIARRKFALAVAQGVVGHLDANEQAFVVDVPNVGGSTVEKTIRVDTA